ncbi:GNAT family N-acetyltransferase [Desulfospira joergensenii]|uniref:GNAT family N-acetyltransferase n=1 Tax=Desulfospira joergensenii TaxID=53329 RepID=UPI0003B54C64|nr:GNAT family N-acetyltransferase [Desulfospira joergensenii]
MNIIVTRPRGEEDKTGLFRFLYRIWAREIKQDLPGTDHGRKEIRDRLDPLADHFMAMDEEGRIVGCVRVNHLSRGIPDPSLFQNMEFDRLAGLFGPDRVAFISRLAIDPAHRGGTVISLLLADLFCHLFGSRITTATCYCRINLVHLYHRIGMRPYLKHFRLDTGIRVPLIGCIQDGPYLEKVKSPLKHLLPHDCNDQGRSAAMLKDAFPGFGEPELPSMGSRSLWAQLAFASPAEDSKQNLKFFNGLSQAKADQIMGRLPRLSLGPNEVIQAGPKDDVFMGVVLKGSLGVGVGDLSDPHFVYIISPGEPFGELPALTQTRQPALLLSMEESEILLIPENLFSRLGKKNPGLAMDLYQNILGILAHRMGRLHEELARSISTFRDLSPGRIRRPALHETQVLKAGPARVESYHFDTLSDKKGEYQRLTTQAQISEKLEFTVLKKIGLKNGDTILDLGSGPGVTSMLLARYFPQSRIIGIEPDRELREEAEKRTRDLPLCRFLEGTGQAIPLKNHDVDFSYARLLFQHIPDPMDTIREMIRVTRPGGILCIMDVDDGTIFIHPESREWHQIEERVARAQAQFGGDRHVGRKLLSYLMEAGLEQVQVDLVPVTTQMLGPEMFFNIVFGFKQQHLKRAGDWDSETRDAFARLRIRLGERGAFASENIFAAHAMVPHPS